MARSKRKATSVPVHEAEIKYKDIVTAKTPTRPPATEEEQSTENGAGSAKRIRLSTSAASSDTEATTASARRHAQQHGGTATVQTASLGTGSALLKPSFSQHLDLEAYNVRSISVISSTQIQARVSRILSHLSLFSFAEPGAKPGLVVVYAKGGVAAKAISVVEIAKREIAKQGARWYQYSLLESVIVDMPSFLARTDPSKLDSTRHGHGDQAEDEAMADVAEEDQEEAFERMEESDVRQAEAKRTAADARPKIRATPKFIIFLSMVRVQSLKRSYG